MSTFKDRVLAMAEVILPPVHENPALKQLFWDSFNGYYSDLDRDSASKLDLLSKVINILCFLNHFKSLEKLEVEKREAFLKKIYFSPIKLVSAGFTGLRSLILVSYYGMPQSWQEIGYTGPLVNRPA